MEKTYYISFPLYVVESHDSVRTEDAVYRSNKSITEVYEAYEKSVENSGIDFYDICYDNDWITPEDFKELEAFGVLFDFMDYDMEGLKMRISEEQYLYMLLQFIKISLPDWVYEDVTVHHFPLEDIGHGVRHR